MDKAPANPLFIAPQQLSTTPTSDFSRSSPKGIAAIDFTLLPLNELANLAQGKDTSRSMKEDIVWCVCAEIINACGYSASTTVRNRVLEQLYGHQPPSKPVKELLADVVLRLQRVRCGMFRYLLIEPIIKYVGAPVAQPSYRSSMSEQEFSAWVSHATQAIFEAVTAKGGAFVRYILGWFFF